MSAPFAYVGTWAIKDDKVEEARKYLADHCSMVEANEPRLIAFHMFLAEDGRSGSVVQLHPDAESMEFHMNFLADHLGEAFDYLDHVISEQYFGTPTSALSESLSPWESSAVATTWKPSHVGGFTRTAVQ